MQQKRTMMPKKYDIHAVEEDGNYFFCVYENATEMPFDFFYFEEDAKACADFMEKGGAFNGFTPKYILIPINTGRKKEDINSKFSTEFKT